MYNTFTKRGKIQKKNKEKHETSAVGIIMLIEFNLLLLLFCFYCIEWLCEIGIWSVDWVPVGKFRSTFHTI